MATQIGTSLDIGAGTITGSYIVESAQENGKDIDFEDIMDQDGARYTRIVYNADALLTLNLVCLASAEPETDFIEGAIAAHTDFTSFWVESAKVDVSKSAKRVTVELKNIGIS